MRMCYLMMSSEIRWWKITGYRQMDRPMERRTHPHIETRERISKCRRTINNISKHNISSFSLLVSLFDLLLLQNFDSRQVSPAETDNIYRQKGQKRQQRQKGQKRQQRQKRPTYWLWSSRQTRNVIFVWQETRQCASSSYNPAGRPTDRPAAPLTRSWHKILTR